MTRPRPAPRTRSELDLVVMGYSAPQASPAAKLRMTEFSILLSHFAMIDVSITALASYERVAQLIHKSEIDLAWLSPIPFISLARQGSVIPLASHYRRGSAMFPGAIIVHAGSRARSLADLRGKRAAWVDRHSASGFVLPRIEFWEAGIDPRKAFSSQRFYGSHEAVVRAVAEGYADFGATYGHSRGRAGSWTTTPHASLVRPLTTFGEIPADVIAARTDLQPKAREIITKAFMGLSSVDRGAELIREVFGADDFRRPDLESYERLRDDAAGANEEGILEVGIDEVEVDDGGADRTIETKARPRADSTMEADVFEVIEPEPPRKRQPSRPQITKLVAPRPAAVPRPTKSKPVAATRPTRPVPPRRT